MTVIHRTEVVVTLGRSDFRVPLRLDAVVCCSISDLRYGGAIP